MPLLYVCPEAHAWVPDTDGASAPPEPCIVCGALATLRDEPSEGEDDEPGPVPPPPGYEILGPLHGGALSRAFRARHRPSRRTVALKLSGRDPRTRALVRREAAALVELEHPNVVRIVGSGEATGRAFLATEWQTGGTLARRLADGPIPAREAIALVARLADAAEHVHRRRFLHRDIRPLNVVLGRRGEPKLVDFGFVRRLDRPCGRARSGSGSGDPRYMAPEQEDGPGRRLGPAVDVHALGAILYQAVTGRPPFRGIPLEERIRPAGARAPAPGVLRPGLPAALDGICERCLRHDPRRRYAGAAELAEDLRSLLRG